MYFSFPSHVFSSLEIAPTFQPLEPNNPLFLSPSAHTSIHQILFIIIVKIFLAYIFYSPFPFLFLISHFDYSNSLLTGTLPYLRCGHIKSVLHTVSKIVFLNNKSSNTTSLLKMYSVSCKIIANSAILTYTPM